MKGIFLGRRFLVSLEQLRSRSRSSYSHGDPVRDCNDSKATGLRTTIGSTDNRFQTGPIIGRDQLKLVPPRKLRDSCQWG